MKCLECDSPAHARGRCSAHYMRWYRANREEARLKTVAKNRNWKFTAEHWWSWWESRNSALVPALHEGIEDMRQLLESHR